MSDGIDYRARMRDAKPAAKPGDRKPLQFVRRRYVDPDGSVTFAMDRVTPRIPGMSGDGLTVYVSPVKIAKG